MAVAGTTCSRFVGNLRNPGGTVFPAKRCAVVSGAAIVDGSVCWGTGYHIWFLGLPYAGDNHKLYAFSVAKQ